MLEQAKAFENLGFDVDKVYLSKLGIVKNENLVKECNLSNLGIASYYEFFGFLKFIYNEFNTSEYSAIYIRYMPLGLNLPNFIKRIKTKNNKIIIEIPTIHFINEFSGISKYLANFQFRRMELNKNYLDNVLYIGHLNDSSIFSNKAKRIPNCVNPVSFSLKQKIEYGSEMNLIMTAAHWKWQGIEIILYSIHDYLQLKDKKFNPKILLIGEGLETSKLTLLAKELNLLENVIFIKPLYGMELNDYFDKAHIAIGTISKNYVSSLKHREYGVRGIPFIYTNDEDLDDMFYCKKISLFQNKINFSEIVDFYETIKRNTDVYLPIKIRETAAAKFSWEKYFKEII
jgi:hypothetical protein